MEVCQQLRQYDAVSIAAGTQPKVVECGEEATDSVYVNGEVHQMCERCAKEATEQFSATQVSAERVADAARLRTMAETVGGWVSEFDSRPEIGAWLAEVANGLAAIECDILEGRA